MRLRFPKPKREAKAKSPVKRTSRPRKQRKGKKAATARKCDIAWSQAVRASGPCRLAGVQLPVYEYAEGAQDALVDPHRRIASYQQHVCSGPIQAAHIFSRRYRGTRWELANGVPLCSGGHLRMTYDPLLWDDLIRQWLGPLYQVLRARAQSVSKPDYTQILLTLQAEVERQSVA